MSTISLRATDAERKLIGDVAQLHGKTISQYIKDVVLERIEDEYDLKVYDEALKEYQDNPISYSLEEIKERHGLSGRAVKLRRSRRRYKARTAKQS